MKKYNNKQKHYKLPHIKYKHNYRTLDTKFLPKYKLFIV